MTSLHKMMIMASANLLALGVTAVDTLMPVAPQDESGNTIQMNEGHLRAIEASHLEVYAACKWGHAAFDPVRVDDEFLTPEVSALHALMA